MSIGSVGNTISQPFSVPAYVKSISTTNRCIAIVVGGVALLCLLAYCCRNSLPLSKKKISIQKQPTLTPPNANPPIGKAIQPVNKEPISINLNEGPVQAWKSLGMLLGGDETTMQKIPQGRWELPNEHVYVKDLPKFDNMPNPIMLFQTNMKIFLLAIQVEMLSTIYEPHFELVSQEKYKEMCETLGGEIPVIGRLPISLKQPPKGALQFEGKYYVSEMLKDTGQIVITIWSPSQPKSVLVLNSNPRHPSLWQEASMDHLTSPNFAHSHNITDYESGTPLKTRKSFFENIQKLIKTGKATDVQGLAWKLSNHEKVVETLFPDGFPEIKFDWDSLSETTFSIF